MSLRPIPVGSRSVTLASASAREIDLTIVSRCGTWMNSVKSSKLMVCKQAFLPHAPLTTMPILFASSGLSSSKSPTMLRTDVTTCASLDTPNGGRSNVRSMVTQAPFMKSDGSAASRWDAGNLACTQISVGFRNISDWQTPRCCITTERWGEICASCSGRCASLYIWFDIANTQHQTTSGRMPAGPGNRRGVIWALAVTADWRRGPFSASTAVCGRLSLSGPDAVSPQ